ncbi:hypothetical protein BJ170DRAFT_711877 [Xylariales sp. AK1849]|nr:hypothetical protein BJ170DRAFT_711877 [Xylariales sp. AK1849]
MNQQLPFTNATSRARGELAKKYDIAHNNVRPPANGVFNAILYFTNLPVTPYYDIKTTLKFAIDNDGITQYGTEYTPAHGFAMTLVVNPMGESLVREFSQLVDCAHNLDTQLTTQNVIPQFGNSLGGHVINNTANPREVVDLAVENIRRWAHVRWRALYVNATSDPFWKVEAQEVDTKSAAMTNSMIHNLAIGQDFVLTQCNCNLVRESPRQPRMAEYFHANYRLSHKEAGAILWYARNKRNGTEPGFSRCMLFVINFIDTYLNLKRQVLFFYTQTRRQSRQNVTRRWMHESGRMENAFDTFLDQVLDIIRQRRKPNSTAARITTDSLFGAAQEIRSSVDTNEMISEYNRVEPGHRYFGRFRSLGRSDPGPPLHLAESFLREPTLLGDKREDHPLIAAKPSNYSNSRNWPPNRSQAGPSSQAPPPGATAGPSNQAQSGPQRSGGKKVLWYTIDESSDDEGNAGHPGTAAALSNETTQLSAAAKPHKTKRPAPEQGHIKSSKKQKVQEQLVSDDDIQV